MKTLSAEDQALVTQHLERVSIKRGDILEAAGEPIPYVYFPDEGLVSVVARMQDGKPVEVGMVGREGMTGASVVLDDFLALNEVRVQIGGAAVRIPSAVLRRLVSKSPSLHAVCLRYVQVLISQVAQTAVAAAHLTVQARLARWLLMVQDRVGSDQFSLTHELLAMMLGVRRPGVTVAMHMLEGEHLIRSTRANVQIVDRDGLEALASTSYGIPEGLYRRLFPNANVFGGPDRSKPASS
ncbi:Crp/Fnr family transcriptional regulator [Allomesorhizobium alhagi]|uniref:Crp/Fnr family transcriptional regulator n=1 Tax=Allomesorhizobium alhagi TaxID=475067 RepID=UPI001FCB734A|nr:Crp/Fnr family transcriptional regulator [Mesorhizobium alhagi]